MVIVSGSSVAIPLAVAAAYLAGLSNGNSMLPAQPASIQGQSIHELDLTKNERIGWLEFSPDSQWLLTIGANDSARTLWRLPKSGPPEMVTRLGDDDGYLRFLDDGRLLRLGQAGLVISAPDKTKNVAPIITAEWFAKRVASISVSQDGHWLCVNNWDGTGTVFQLSTKSATPKMDLPISRTALPWFDPQSHWLVIVSSENEKEINDVIQGRVLSKDETQFAVYDNVDGNWQRRHNLRLYKTLVDARITADNHLDFIGDSFYASMYESYQQWLFGEKQLKHVAIRSLHRPLVLENKWLVTFGDSDYLKHLDELTTQQPLQTGRNAEHRENVKWQQLSIWKLSGDRSPQLIRKLNWKSKINEGSVIKHLSDENHLVLSVGDRLGTVEMPPSSDAITWIDFETKQFSIRNLFSRTCRDGNLLAVNPLLKNDDVTFYKLDGPRLLTNARLRLDVSNAKHQCFSTSGRYFAVAGQFIRLWKMKNGMPLVPPLKLMGAVQEFRRVHFSSNDKWAYAYEPVRNDDLDGDRTARLLVWRLPDN